MFVVPPYAAAGHDPEPGDSAFMLMVKRSVVSIKADRGLCNMNFQDDSPYYSILKLTAWQIPGMESPCFTLVGE